MSPHAYGASSPGGTLVSALSFRFLQPKIEDQDTQGITSLHLLPGTAPRLARDSRVPSSHECYLDTSTSGLLMESRPLVFCLPICITRRGQRHVMARVCPAGLWGAIVMEGVTILGIDTQTVVSGACLPESESVCFRLQDIACDTVWHAHLMRFSAYTPRPWQCVTNSGEDS